MANVRIDKKELDALYESLDKWQRDSIIRHAVRNSALFVRREAVARLRRGVKSNAKLDRTVRHSVFKTNLGYRISVTSYKKKGMYTNHLGQERPVVFWLESGTRLRRRGGKIRNGKFRAYKKQKSKWGARGSTGALPAINMLRDAAKATEPMIMQRIENAMYKSVEKVAKIKLENR